MVFKVKEKLENEKIHLLKELSSTKERLKSVTLAKTNEDL
jgi:hypothetical protein